MKAVTKNKGGARPGNKNAVGNKGGGAPSKYKPEFAKQAFRLCLMGAIDTDLADFFEVTEPTINTWKKDHVEFSLALKKGKQVADGKVAHKLYQRATGYSHPDIDIKVIENKIVKTDLIKHYPPDTTAGIFWLKNRQKDKWRDKQTVEIEWDKLSDDQLDNILKRIIEMKKGS